jgi:hypothetical protein
MSEIPRGKEDLTKSRGFSDGIRCRFVWTVIQVALIFATLSFFWRVGNPLAT